MIVALNMKLHFADVILAVIDVAAVLALCRLQSLKELSTYPLPSI